MDPRNDVDAKNCRVCKEPIPEDFKKSTRWVSKQFCSWHCYNKLNWKIERTQLVFGCAFGLLLLWLTVSNNNAMGAAVTSAITMAFVIYKIKEMKDYPWRD